jgi:GrpB-like predicted nucleotidyltransferase (UPF0157 family)
MEAGANRGDMGYEIDTAGLTAHQAAETIWKDIHEAVEIVPFRSTWEAEYAAEETRIRAALGARALTIHHIGSTAVPGLDAKPIIDIMVVVRRLQDAADCIAPLRKLGYAFIDYPQNTDRRFFRKGIRRPDGGGTRRTHHLHIVEQNSASFRDHLAFRDALRARPVWRQEYADLKAGLASQHKKDRAIYSERKTAFVARVVRSWLKENNP